MRLIHCSHSLSLFASLLPLGESKVCSLGSLRSWLQPMELIFFQSDTHGPSGVLTTTDGKVDFLILGEEFGLEPRTIKLCDIVVSKTDDESKAPWTQLRVFLQAAGTEADPVMVRGRPVIESRTDEVVDHSEAWIRHMLLPQLPELPRNRADLTTVLFPTEQQQKLPVTKRFYKVSSVAMPELAAEFLIEADDSVLPCAVSSFLHVPRVRLNTKMNTTLLVASCFSSFFDTFNEYSKHHFELTLAFNSTESQRHGHSETIEARSRPDTIVIASGCTFLVGEDELDDLHAAEADLRSKIKPLNPMYYGGLKFIVGYITAGTKLQWIYIGKDGSEDIHRIHRPLNLLSLPDRCSFLLSLGYAFQLLKKMADSVPDVPGRRAMFSKEESLSKKRISYFFANKVVKHIRDFNSHHSVNQGTSLSEIRRAYGVARGSRVLLQAETGPTVTAHGTYKVECTPLGYSCSLKSEQDCRWMARCVCQALCILHEASLLHRDIRLPNIVRLSETEFMLIDFESVATSPFRLHEGFRHFSGWEPEMLEGNQYTPFSDMYSLGKLLDESLPNGKTSLAKEFVRKLTTKQLRASDALQDPWLSGPFASLVS